MFHIVSKQTNGSASGKRVALVPLNAMKRIEKLHASNVHTAKNWERKEIRIFDKQMSCNESFRFWNNIARSGVMSHQSLGLPSVSYMPTSRESPRIF